MLKIKRGQKGFTLIELLIVIAILGILAAVAIPLVSSALNNGKVAAANTEVENVRVAAQMYLVGHTTATSVDSDELLTDGELSEATKVVYTISLPNMAVTADPADEWDGVAMTFDGTRWSR